MKPHPLSWTRRAALAGAAATAALPRMVRAEDLPWRLPELRRVKVHGHEIAYYEMGSGPPLVLAHGMSGSAALEWGRVMTPLARKFRVIAPYQIGFSPSDQPDLAYDAATFVDHLGGLLAARSAEEATIVGESFGGWVVAQYALRQGGRSSWKQALPRISRLVIVDGAVQVHPLPPKPPEASINSPEVGKLAGAFFASQPKADNSKVTKAAGPHVLAQQLTDAELTSIKVPTLVVWGAGDQLLPMSDGRHIASQIPGARSVIIDDCGHIPSVEQPRAFLGALGGFLGQPLEMLS
jgi:pimeloyl-ACP methyl ester carboxylesterase